LDEIRELFNYANRCIAAVNRTYQTKLVLAIGQTLEPMYWEDDGKLIHTKMSEYNRLVQFPAPLQTWGGQARAFGQR
jgi:hypothetical protein